MVTMGLNELWKIALSPEARRVREVVRNLYNHRDHSANLGCVLRGADSNQTMAICEIIADFVEAGENGIIIELGRAVIEAYPNEIKTKK